MQMCNHLLLNLPYVQKVTWHVIRFSISVFSDVELKLHNKLFNNYFKIISSQSLAYNEFSDYLTLILYCILKLNKK